MFKPQTIYAAVAFLSGLSAVWAADENFTGSLRITSDSAITAYSSILSNAPAALARTYVSGNTGTKGIVGEAVASKNFLQISLRKTGNWHSISPRIGAQGIDHIFLKIDPKTALPQDIIVGESKYNTSRLGKTVDGLQLTSRWTKPRLRAMGARYYRLSSVTTIQKAPMLGGQHEMKIVLKNGKEVCFWRKSSQDGWKFSGTKTELREAQRLAKVYGNYLSAAGEGKIVYRSRLFQILPRGNDIVIVVKDAAKLDVLQQADKLPETQRIVLSNVLRKKLSEDAEREIAKSLKGKFPAYSEKELAKLAKEINSTARGVLTPYGKLNMLGTFAVHAGVASILAVTVDASLQYFSTGHIDSGKLIFSGSTVFLGTIGAQYLEVGLAKWSVAQGVFKSLGRTLGCSSSLLGSAFSSAAGGLLVGLAFTYGSWYMGYTDLETANRMAVASSIGTGLGLAAGYGTLAAISAWGTASTGTAIATLSGAAAKSATLALLGGGATTVGGGGVVVGTAILTGGIVVVAIVGTGAVMIVYNLIDKKQEFDRITELCKYMSTSDAVDKMLKNVAVPIQ